MAALLPDCLRCGVRSTDSKQSKPSGALQITAPLLAVVDNTLRQCLHLLSMDTREGTCSYLHYPAYLKATTSTNRKCAIQHHDVVSGGGRLRPHEAAGKKETVCCQGNTEVLDAVELKDRSCSRLPIFQALC